MDDGEDNAMQSTQQETQPDSQEERIMEDLSHLWGRLVPCNPGLKRLDFLRTQAVYTLGRASTVDYTLKTPKISAYHCQIEWHQDAVGERFVLRDNSTNGTYVSLSPIRDAPLSVSAYISTCRHRSMPPR